MSVYAKDPGDTDRVLCCAGWEGPDACEELATDEVDGDPYCAAHGREARAQRDASERAAGVGLYEPLTPFCAAPHPPGCSCPDDAVRHVSALLGEPLELEAEPMTGTTPEDQLRLQDHLTEDYE